MPMLSSDPGDRRLLPSTDADPRAALAESAASSRRSQQIFIYGTGLAIGLQSGFMNYALWHKLPSALFVIFGALVYAALMQLLWQRVLPRFSRLTLGRRIAAQTVVSLLAFGALSVAVIEL